MALVNRPDYTVKWAESGNKLQPTSEKVELGHVVEKPPYELVNWIENKQDSAITYLMQEGISDWSLDQDYSATSYVKYNGVIYRAKVSSLGKQPDIETAVWEIAFVDYQDYKDLTQDLYDTKNTAGHAANLVYKNAPIMTARADGTSYKADVGTSLTPTDNVGYVFDGKETDGVFHDGTKVVVQKGGAIVAELDDALSNNDGKQVVTKDYLRQYLELYGIGDLFITTRNGNPSTLLGYGTWSRFGQGRTLVSFSEQSSTNPVWTKFINNEYGEYTHQLTESELPPHNHPATQAGDANNVVSGSNLQLSGTTNGGYSSAASNAVGSTGGNQPHNNVQPSIVVHMWIRVS